MAENTPADGKRQRSESRRQQVLDAAALCFRRSGFRGASMAEISAEASMSTGHIYHYFKNKEAIVEAIVARDMEQSANRLDSLKELGADHLFDAMMLIAEECISERDDVSEPALLLEVAAEASRNPLVAAILGDCKITMHGRLKEVLRLAQARGAVGPDIDLDGICLVISTLFDGITAQSVINPLFQREKLLMQLRPMLACLFRPA